MGNARPSTSNEYCYDTKDLEASKPATIVEPSLDADANTDPDLITRSRPDDPENPNYWPKRSKWKNTWVISLFVFISPVSLSMIAAMRNLGKALVMLRC
ncbi:uncharacterized protein N7500_004918 [Penicillium coprophilum]|uniref:uncharacterized protein n=1 Tax=Penicillium coprophilum TaxID=36646 RepID=UPI00238F1CAD|nr:uncharacterized protein N7500_004918 [Penicillium coprophilum]KAJ5163088.1 hypothetical protein N7500_004918 [Penicillium coprophilum]